ncbi:hypothetical protein ACWGN5_38495 [Streptomyces sp. NPDC055815]
MSVRDVQRDTPPDRARVRTRPGAPQLLTVTAQRSAAGGERLSLTATGVYAWICLPDCAEFTAESLAAREDDDQAELLEAYGYLAGVSR